MMLGEDAWRRCWAKDPRSPLGSSEYSSPKPVVEDPHDGGPLSQKGRGEKTDVINHLGLL